MTGSENWLRLSLFSKFKIGMCVKAWPRMYTRLGGLLSPGGIWRIWKGLLGEIMVGKVMKGEVYPLHNPTADWSHPATSWLPCIIACVWKRERAADSQLISMARWWGLRLSHRDLFSPSRKCSLDRPFTMCTICHRTIGKCSSCRHSTFTGRP